MVVCCLDAFDPVPDQVETRPKGEKKASPIVLAPVQNLETETAEDSETETEEEEETEYDLEEILVSGKALRVCREC
jgi:hypothetical protein